MAIKGLGLIGYQLEHSFSERYFTEKFKREGISNWEYKLYPLCELDELFAFIHAKPYLQGFNVTVPYKVAVMDMLDEISPEARAVGAVNTISIQWQGAKPHLSGYNTDTFGFETLLHAIPYKEHPRALILGTGGGAKAVKYVLDKAGIMASYVSTSAERGILFDALDREIIAAHTLIVNATPLGMWPAVETLPPIPYDALSSRHVLLDLVYNPEKTLFMKQGLKMGATALNGLKMLYAQADKAWEIWREHSGE